MDDQKKLLNAYYKMVAAGISHFLTFINFWNDVNNFKIF